MLDGKISRWWEFLRRRQGRIALWFWRLHVANDFWLIYRCTKWRRIWPEHYFFLRFFNFDQIRFSLTQSKTCAHVIEVTWLIGMTHVWVTWFGTASDWMGGCRFWDIWNRKFNFVFALKFKIIFFGMTFRVKWRNLFVLQFLSQLGFKINNLIFVTEDCFSFLQDFFLLFMKIWKNINLLKVQPPTQNFLDETCVGWDERDSYHYLN